MRLQSQLVRCHTGRSLLETTLLSTPHDPSSEVCGFWISLGIPRHPARSLEKGNGVTQGLLGARPRKCPKDVCPCALELSQVQSYKGGWNMEQSLVPWRKRKWVLADPRSPHHVCDCLELINIATLVDV